MHCFGPACSLLEDTSRKKCTPKVRRRFKARQNLSRGAAKQTRWIETEAKMPHCTWRASKIGRCTTALIPSRKLRHPVFQYQSNFQNVCSDFRALQSCQTDMPETNAPKNATILYDFIQHMIFEFQQMFFSNKNQFISSVTQFKLSPSQSDRFCKLSNKTVTNQEAS